jgi:hypothetical protein
MDSGLPPEVEEQVEAVVEAYGCSYEEAVTYIEWDVEPSAWDPEPEPPPEVRARFQALVYETRERVRMRDGFYIDALRDDLEAEADADEEEGDASPPDSERIGEGVGQRRPGAAPGRTVRVRLQQLAEERQVYPEAEHQRPRTRAECGEERPCPYVSCEYHLYLDIARRRDRIRLNFPDLDVEDMAETCALDLAERGGEPGSGQGIGLTLDTIAACMNLTSETVRKIEIRARGKLRRLSKVTELGREFGVGGEGTAEAAPSGAEVRADVELEIEEEGDE